MRVHKLREATVPFGRFPTGIVRTIVCDAVSITETVLSLMFVM